MTRFLLGRYLLLVLMEAERAWSYAMQLKQEANTEPRKRFHLLSRLRKAAKHSQKLEKLCESPRVDAKTKLEAQVPPGGRGGGAGVGVHIKSNRTRTLLFRAIH